MHFYVNQIQKTLTKKDCVFFDKEKFYDLNSIGIQNNNTVSNSFDDSLYVIYRNDNPNLLSYRFDATTDPGTCEGLFGINIHRSNAQSKAQAMEKQTSGCTVFKNPADFNFFIEICRKARNIHENSFSSNKV